MFHNSTLAKSVKLALAFGAASAIGLSASVSAQEQEQAEEEGVEKIQVTGSRLAANPNLASATPVLSISGEEAAIRGNVRIEDFVNVLPQVFAGQASEISNGATGTATLNLRGLGSQRTLVLIDGKRLPYGSSQIASANLDLIPTQLLESVDIVTGGASAVYGSDAVGGVANFIMQKDFEGLEVGGQWSTNYNDNDDDFWANVLRAGNQPVPGSEWGGEENLVFIKMGANSDDGRGNVTLFASYEDRGALNQSERVFSGCALGQDDGPESFGGFGCVGSGNFRAFGGPGGFGFQEESGEIVPFAGGPSQTFNFGPFNFFQRPSQRYNLYARGNYELTDDLEVYAEFSYMNTFSDAQIAPTASFGGNWSINCSNPFISGTPGLDLATEIFGCTPAQIAADAANPGSEVATGLFASHRNVEGGPRNSRLDNSAWRFVAGLNGVIDDTWSYSAFIQTSDTRDSSVATEDFIVANVQQAFLATVDDNGNPVCIDQTGGCVPYNIFQRNPDGSTAVTDAQVNYLQGPGIVLGQTEQLVYGGDIQGNLGDYGIALPWADDNGIAVLFGFEYREDSLISEPDVISQTPGGGFTGVGGGTSATAGEVEVTEFFTEVQIPIAVDKAFAHELTFSAQYRYSDYDVDGNNVTNSFDTDAYGFNLTWAPIEDVRLRAQYQVAVRAPNVIELFEAQDSGLPNLSPFGTNSAGTQLFDPCASSAPLLSLEQCALTGVTADQYGRIQDVISGQTQSITGGNPLLNPEEADTVTFGVVITPSAIENLSISIDYFDITVDDAIEDGIPAQTVLNECLATGDATFCDLINRTAQGSLAAGGGFGTGFAATNVNIATLETSGVDAQILYHFDIADYGTLRFDYAATFLDNLDTEPFPGGALIECGGAAGAACGVPAPEYRHRFLTTWQTPWDLDLQMTWRYFDEVDNDNPNDLVEPTLDSVNYIDVTATYQAMENLQLRFGVLNLLGEDPPVLTSAGPPFGNGNTYPSVYDTSTNVFVGATATF